MQNKGAIKFLAVMLTIACAFQLSFTFMASGVTDKAESLPVEERTAFLDSMRGEVIYDLGFVEYTYADCLEKEINLGLDLRGGMNVTLQIAVEDILTALAGSNATMPEFTEAMAQAKAAQANSTSDFITLFADAYQSANPQGSLARIFGTYELREQVNPSSTNDQVIDVLRAESQSAIDNSFNVLSNRINRFGVTQPNVQQLGNSGRILVELPGVKDPERVRKLLQGTANLEFWTTYNATQMIPMFVNAAGVISSLEADNNTTVETATEEVVEQEGIATTEAVGEENIVADLAAQSTSTVDTTGVVTASGLFAVFQPYEFDSPAVGVARSFDTVKVNEYLALPQVKALFPRDVKFMWGIKAADEAQNIFELFAIKGGATGKAPLDGGAVEDAVGEYGQQGAFAEVSMVMNASGAKTWARLTADNIGSFVAVVLDDYVYNAPRILGEITGGRTSITGDFTITEARDLANVLKSGKLPAPARIVQESVVGPTLGQESIDAGMGSFIIAFAFVLLYMIFFYSRAGLAASVALIANLFFLFGVLVSFGAVLTLPGIAGIVLTMGMAVDANVIIYERIKEEMNAGKGFSMSVADGFRNAYSAIIDGNATTLITGIVLFAFGSGPVQGFATTLIIGILTSLFCSIFITRLIFEAIAASGKKLPFWIGMTKNFLAKSKINFIGMRKKMYIFSAILFVAVVASLATRGLQLGVDFSGGRTYVVRFDSEVNSEEVRGALQNVFTDGLEVKQFGTTEQMQMRITTQYKYDDVADGVNAEIESMLYNALSSLYNGGITLEEFTSTTTNPLGIISTDTVGPTIAHDIKRNAFIAVIFALVVIGLYIATRFRNWQYGVGGVVSLLHDAIITIGMFSLLYTIMPFNLTIDQSFIAAILTIIGYSINDTVVIFDRIRENVNLFPKRSLKDNMNNALNQTLARTINTAGSTVIVLLAMFIFGGEVIRGFVFALLFGVIIGTFSSLFIATPVAYDLIQKGEKKKGAKK